MKESNTPIRGVMRPAEKSIATTWRQDTIIAGEDMSRTDRIFNATSSNMKNWMNCMSYKHRKVCTTQNYIRHLLILVPEVTGCVSISAFASLVGIPIGIASSAIWLKFVK